jgi:hypothetical protein
MRNYLCGGYAALVLLLGIISVVTLLTVQDPILLTGVALIVLTFPLGTLLWWLRDNFVPDLDPVILIVLLTAAGLFQAWIVWRLLRPAR